MSEPPIPDDDERVSRKVIYEHTASSGNSRYSGVTIAVIAVIAVLAVILIAYILMHMHH
jgi:hypothetical protein